MNRFIFLILTLLPVVISSQPNSESTFPPFATSLNSLAAVSPPKYICETSSASPLVKDIIQAAQGLYDMGNDARCTQSGFITKCTAQATRYSASIGLCGVTKHWMNCRKLGQMAVYLATGCKKAVGGEWRAGGKIENNPEHITVIVYNSRDN